MVILEALESPQYVTPCAEGAGGGGWRGQEGVVGGGMWGGEANGEVGLSALTLTSMKSGCPRLTSSA